MTHVHIAAMVIPACLLGAALVARHTPEPDVSGFAFERHKLVSLGGDAKGIREVHPGFHHIGGWISSVGASVAAFDHDGDGLNNDYCLVDPRFDSVTIGPVPTTGNRFAPFAVEWRQPAKAEAGIAPMGCMPLDADRDGAQDLALYYWGRAPSLHLAAEGFEPRPLLDSHEVWNTNAATLADFDGDGRLDLLFGNYFPDGMPVLGGPGEVHMQRSMSRAQNAGRNRLFLASDDGGLFRDASAALDEAMPNGWTLATGAADLDGDGLPEIYVANDFGSDQLLHNLSADGVVKFSMVQGVRGLTTPRSRVLGRDSFKGMGVDFGDIDRDGTLDLYVSNIAEDYALMESHLMFRGTGDASAFAKGRAPFEEISGRIGLARSAWAWDARMADFNNDGVPEVLQATGFLKGDTDRWPELHETAMGNDELLQFAGLWPRFREGADLSGDRVDAFFVANDQGGYVDMATALGFDRGTISRGIALADVDGDGDQDALIARQWMDSILLKNTAPPARSGVVLDLRIENPDGTTSPAVGAIVTLSAEGSDLKLTDIVAVGDGHSGKNAPELHFGLGAWPEDTPISAEITWRDALATHRRVIDISPGRQRVVLLAWLASASKE